MPVQFEQNEQTREYASTRIQLSGLNENGNPSSRARFDIWELKLDNALKLPEQSGV